MEKQKHKNKKTRSSLELGCIGVFGAVIILGVPTFCFWAYSLLSIGLSSASYTSNGADLVMGIIFIVPLIGLLTAIGTAYYTVKVMNLYRVDGIVSLTTIMSAATMIVTYLLASRLWAIVS